MIIHQPAAATCYKKPMAPTTLLVVGRINSPNFQKARALAEAVNDVVAATVEMMLPADYDRYLTKTKLEYGSTAWAHTASVMVTSDSGYVGDDEALIAWLRTRKLSTAVLNSDGQAVAWEQVADSEYAHYLATSGNQYAFMDIAVDGQQVGRLLFELFATKLPKTCANFLQLCTGGSELSSGRPLHYRDSPIHRVVKGAWIQGGDIVAGNGSNGASVFGDTIPDESFCIPHDQVGSSAHAMHNMHMPHATCHMHMHMRMLCSRHVHAMDTPCTRHARVTHTPCTTRRASSAWPTRGRTRRTPSST